MILKCQAVVSSSGQEPLSRHYTIYKDGEEVYTKTSSTSEDLLYRLPEARVSNTGKYKCQITIEDKKMISDFKKLTVTGSFVYLDVINSSLTSLHEFECDQMKLIGYNWEQFYFKNTTTV